MRNLRSPDPFIACTTALVLVLAGCSINIEATNLSAITVENDRTIIEKTLGKPDQVVEAQGFTVASYKYDKGYHRPAPPGPYIGRFYHFISVPIEFAREASEARALQKGQLAAVFDTDDKLLFAGFLEKLVSTDKSLALIATRYQEAQSGNEAALIDLSKFAMIPGQKKMFLETAVNTGSAEAAFELGQAYQLGAGVEQNDAKAMKWWLQAAEKDFVPAYKQLGKTYRFGTANVERDLQQSRHWFTKAAERGDTDSQQRLADFYRFGEGTDRNITKAIDLYERAAEGGNGSAQYILGTLYDFGSEVEPDRIAAFKWYTIAERNYASFKFRKSDLSEKLTPEQITEAERMARDWLAAHPQ